jgi:cytochrome c-type biogenesis protein CcmH|tara:strand:+ start:158 stop:565 length:408 start_codon:yes stop_codon:yes gene_type:complete
MKKIKLYHYFIGLILISITTFALSVEPEEFMKDPKKELRAREISKNIRCVVCQNQSIDDSSAQLARDLRLLIRQKIKEGSTDKQIYNFLTERYGDFILLNPPLKTSTIFLWLFPFGLLFIGFFVILKHHKKSKVN